DARGRWLSPGRSDRRSVFARLLGAVAGHWSLPPAGEADISRRYLEGAMVLETTFRPPAGTLVLLDPMAAGPDELGHELGRGSPGVLLRRAQCVDGRVDLSIEYQPRMEYGLVHPLLVPVEGAVVARGGADVLVLSCAAALEIQRTSAGGTVKPSAGESMGFPPEHRTNPVPGPPPVT